MTSSVALVVRVMARPERRDRAEALAAEAGGIVVYDPEPWLSPSPAGTWRCARRAWLHGAQGGGTHVVVVQDDVKLCQAFRRVASSAVTARQWAAITFFARRRQVEDAHARGEHWAQIPDFLMAQAVCLPKSWVVPFVTWSDALPSDLGDDARLKRWLKHTRTPMWATVPSLVEHDPEAQSLIPGRTNINRTARRWAGDASDLSTVNWIP